MAVYRIKRKRNIFVHTIALRTVFLRPTNHGPLQRISLHDCHTALITGRITTVCVNGSCRPGFIKTAMRIT